MTAGTKRHKSFKTPEQDERQDVTFDLDGETFSCYPEMSGAVLLDFITAAEEGSTKVASKILWLIERSMADEEYARFRAFVDDPARLIKMETLSEVVEYLIEEYTERPTPASSASGSGRTSRTRGSTESS